MRSPSAAKCFGRSCSEASKEMRRVGTLRGAASVAAVDEDAAAVVSHGLSPLDDPDVDDWRSSLIFTLVGALDGHPLARRLLAGLEPEVTPRVLEIPALAELRKACTERLRGE